jgi:hypothetical protein
MLITRVGLRLIEAFTDDQPCSWERQPAWQDLDAIALPTPPVGLGALDSWVAGALQSRRVGWGQAPWDEQARSCVERGRGTA